MATKCPAAMRAGFGLPMSPFDLAILVPAALESICHLHPVPSGVKPSLSSAADLKDDATVNSNAGYLTTVGSSSD